MEELKQGEFWLSELEVVADAIKQGLAGNYAEVSVSVAPCPDLQECGSAFSGLNGSPFLVEIGGEPLVHNPNYRDRGSFDLTSVMKDCGRPAGKILGAGFPSLVATGGKCGELMPCIDMPERNLTKIARSVGDDKHCVVEDYPSLLHGGLGNLYVSDGLTGDVIHVEARCRTGEEGSFAQAIRTAILPLVEGVQGKELALGGLFNVIEGQIRSHISPDFDCIPFAYYDQDKDEHLRMDFLRFFAGMGPDLMCMSILWTGDPTGGDLHLRANHEHTHFFSTAGRAEAGHYHNDITPETIHYRGYFQLAERVYRVGDIYAEIAQRKHGTDQPRNFPL